MNRFLIFKPMDLQTREAMLQRIERLTELPLLLLSFAMIPLLLGPLMWDLSYYDETLFFTLDVFIWALFAADLLVKLAIAPDRLGYARRHWLEVLIVLIPFIRPLRILRLVVFGARAFGGARRLVNVDFLLVYAIGMVILAATFVTSVERGHDSITSFPDALWWSFVTVTTVGYGDLFPVTPLGRAIAIVLMLVGIGLFGGLTANLASAIVKSEDNVEGKVDALLEEVRELRTQVVSLETNTEGTVQDTGPGRPSILQGFSLPGAANIIRGRLSGAFSRMRGRSQQPNEAVEPRGEDMPDAQTFRQAWGKFATGVSIVTTADSDGSVHGMTANGITSVSLDPLLVLVCAGHTTTSYPLIRDSRRFAINILSEDQQDVAAYYARPTDQKTGDVDIAISQTERGGYIVDGSLAQMDCRVVTEHVAGDHTIFIGEVEEVNVGDGRPLLFFEGRFGQLAEG